MTDTHVTLKSPQQPPRRRYTAEEKDRIVGESYHPGVSVAALARKHAMNANLIFTWRRERKKTEGAVSLHPNLIPIVVDHAPAPAVAAPSPVATTSTIEIDLKGGSRVRFSGSVGLDVMERIIRLAQGGA